jgi:hypothetical protein
MQNVPGATFIRLDSEEIPFVRRILLPQAMHVGPYHELDYDQNEGVWTARDDHEYEDIVVTDDEYLELMRKGASTN